MQIVVLSHGSLSCRLGFNYSLLFLRKRRLKKLYMRKISSIDYAVGQTGKSKVGAISKAQKAQKNFFEKKSSNF